MRFIAFDIETGPQPLSRLKKILPAWDPSTIKNPGSFDPSSVKLGNMKDQKLIAEKIAKAQDEHSKAVCDYEFALKTGEFDYWREVQEKAALSAITCEILAIGFSHGDLIQDFYFDSWRSGINGEAALINLFFKEFDHARKNDIKLVGFYSNEFDVPTICQRACVLGIKVPSELMNGRFLDSTFVDLSQTWKFGSKNSSTGGLDALAKALGIEGKLEGVTGADFARLIKSENEAEVELAKQYFRQDLKTTFEVAERLL